MTRTGPDCVALLLPPGGVAQWSRRARVADGEGLVSSYCVLPSMQEARWILPLGSPRTFQRTWEVHRPGRFRGKLMHSTIRLTAGLGLFAALPGARLHVAVPAGQTGESSCPLQRWTRRHIGDAVCEFALATGTPGPFRKTSVQAILADGTRLAQIKCAEAPAAAKRIRHEAGVVDRIAELALSSMRSPTPIWSGATEGWEVMIQRPIEGRPPSATAAPVVEFQRELMEKTSETGNPGSGAFWQSLVSRIERFGPDSARSRFRDLHRRLAYQSMNLTFMHGDLASWNLIRTDDAWYATDWELACDGAPPLMDLLHFDIYGPLLLGRATPEAVIDAILGGRAPVRYSQFHSEIGAEGVAWSDLLRDLVSIYLVDRMSRLAEEQAGLHSEDRKAQMQRLLRGLERTVEYG